MIRDGDTPTARSKMPISSPTPVVLLVEDEETVRDVTRLLLERAGYRVLCCKSPEEALQTVAGWRDRLDLLLTDVVMPGMNGPDLAKRLKTMRPTLATLFISGYAEVDVIRQLQPPLASYIQKPFTAETLLSRVAEALNTTNGTDLAPPR